jgi:hypothetical protein
MLSDNVDTIREAVGIFAEPGALHEAINTLLEAGFDTEQIGLLTGEDALKDLLGEFRTEPNGPDSPNTAFVARDSVGGTVRSGLGGLFFAGTTAAAGTAVASFAILGGGLLAAVTGVAAVGAVGAALALVIRQSDADRLEDEIEAGHLLLFVRAHSRQREKLARKIMREQDSLGIITVEAPPRSLPTN